MTKHGAKPWDSTYGLVAMQIYNLMVVNVLKYCGNSVGIAGDHSQA